MDTVIFDLDGTLADTSGDLIAAANACFTDLGHGSPLDPVNDMAVAFAGGRAMLGLGFARCGSNADESVVDREFPLFLAHYRRNIDVFTTLYPGVAAALKELRNNGYALGVCTNKPVELANILLERLGIGSFFDVVLGADSLDVKKPHKRHLLETIARLGGDAGRAVLIGDTVTDRQAAAGAGVPCVLVSFGPVGLGVRDLNPEATLAHFDDLGALIAGLLPPDAVARHG